MNNESVNPFDDDSLTFLVLINDLQQHSLWPVFKTIPKGWHSTFGPASRIECLEYIEKNWTDIRPQALSTPANRV
ncbi:MbtH family protein [Marinomonas sp. TW1]|uniref:MbtH family protein n=1 Tax=Marinomonas sp. TW1 TaxID=1561203 RepID=UPI0007AF51E8|nr:MbtH family protein [Marinomonas sp. TW1]KZN13687.1 antibiotic synthesis protein MbtH [Marinomonas sp. TW1]